MRALYNCAEPEAIGRKISIAAVWFSVGDSPAAGDLRVERELNEFSCRQRSSENAFPSWQFPRQHCSRPGSVAGECRDSNRYGQKPPLPNELRQRWARRRRGLENGGRDVRSLR